MLLLLDAQRELLAAVAAGGVGLVVAAAVNHWWKMSIHTAVAAGALVILMLVYGWPLAPPHRSSRPSDGPGWR